jgi:hypothetical protein
VGEMADSCCPRSRSFTESQFLIIAARRLSRFPTPATSHHRGPRRARRGRAVLVGMPGRAESFHPPLTKWREETGIRRSNHSRYSHSKPPRGRGYRAHRVARLSARARS